MTKVKGNETIYTRKGSVQFVALQPKYRNKPVYFTPIFDRNKNDYLFYPSDCPDKQAESIVKRYIKGPEIQIAVKHNQLLDKSNDKDYAIMLLLMVQYPTVVTNMDDLIPGITIGYLYDKEFAATQTINKVNEEFEAIAKVHNMSYENLRKLAFYLGLNPNTMSIPVMTSSVYEIVKTNPKKILEFFEDQDAEIVSMVNMLRKVGVITTNKGMMYFGKTFLGSSVNEVVANLKQDGFADLLTTLRKRVSDNEVIPEIEEVVKESDDRKRGRKSSNEQ